MLADLGETHSEGGSKGCLLVTRRNTESGGRCSHKTSYCIHVMSPESAESLCLKKRGGHTYCALNTKRHPGENTEAEKEITAGEVDSCSELGLCLPSWSSFLFHNVTVMKDALLQVENSGFG